jgi:ESF2/ABP1 family protein
LWNIKFLKGFKWSHLTEKVAYERRVREQKLRVEMMEIRRENASYVAQVEAGKKLDYIEERKRKRQQKIGASATADGANKDTNQEEKSRKIKQKKPFQGEKAGISLFI